MGSYQIWPYHVTQAKNLSFPYLKSYCPLNFRKSHQISWFCCIPNGSYKEDNLKEGRICPPPPMWNRVKVGDYSLIINKSAYIYFRCSFQGGFPSLQTRKTFGESPLPNTCQKSSDAIQLRIPITSSFTLLRNKTIVYRT